MSSISGGNGPRLKAAVALASISIAVLMLWQLDLGLALAAAVGLAVLLLLSPFWFVCAWYFLMIPEWVGLSEYGRRLMQVGFGGISIMNVASLAILFTCGLSVAQRMARVRLPAILLAQVPLVLLAAVASPAGIADSGSDAVYGALRLMTPAVVGAFVYLECRNRPEGASTVLWALRVSVVLSVFVAVLSSPAAVLSEGRVAPGGLLGWPSGLAYFCAAAICLLLPDLVSSTKSSRAARALSRFALVVGAAGVVLGASRGPWLSLALAMTVMAFLGVGRAAFVAGAVAGAVYLLPELSGRVVLLANQFDARSLEAGSGRLHIWRVMWGEIWNAPLWGHGLGAYFSGTQSLYIGTLSNVYPHNDYLYLWYEMGLLAPLALAASKISWLLEAVKRGLVESKSVKHTDQWAGVAGAGIVLLVGHGFDNLVFMTTMQVIVFATIAALFGAQDGESMACNARLAGE